MSVPSPSSSSVRPSVRPVVRPFIRPVVVVRPCPSVPLYLSRRCRRRPQSVRLVVDPDNVVRPLSIRPVVRPIVIVCPLCIRSIVRPSSSVPSMLLGLHRCRNGADADTALGGRARNPCLHLVSSNGPRGEILKALNESLCAMRRAHRRPLLV